jgi:hypothetical protein
MKEWFLIMFVFNQVEPVHIGPLTESQCLDAAAAVQGDVPAYCRKPVAMTSCPVQGNDVFYSCPVFDIPHITKKNQ